MGNAHWALRLEERSGAVGLRWDVTPSKLFLATRKSFANETFTYQASREEVYEMSIRQAFLTGILTFVLSSVVNSAFAVPMTATYTGTVLFGKDDGKFGTRGADLAGKNFTAVFKYDSDIAGVGIESDLDGTNTDFIRIIGGTNHSKPSPVLSASIQIGTKKYDFTVGSSGYRQGMLESYRKYDPNFSSVFHQVGIFGAYFQLYAFVNSLNIPLDFNTSYDISGNFNYISFLDNVLSFQNSHPIYFTPTRLVVASAVDVVPLPAALPLFASAIAGLGTLALMARRRRS